jgi:hypothetical protein
VPDTDSSPEPSKSKHTKAGRKPQPVDKPTSRKAMSTHTRRPTVLGPASETLGLHTSHGKKTNSLRSSPSFLTSSTVCPRCTTSRSPGFTVNSRPRGGTPTHTITHGTIRVGNVQSAATDLALDGSAATTVAQPSRGYRPIYTPPTGSAWRHTAGTGTLSPSYSAWHVGATLPRKAAC